MAGLDGFLAEAEARQFQDGTWDCCLFPAAWVQRVTGIDGAAPWRGRYSTRIGWLRILKREGGVEGVLSRGAALAGLPETTAPERGDIGVFEWRGEAVAGVYLGERWASVSIHGLTAVRAPTLRAWSILCRS